MNLELKKKIKEFTYKKMLTKQAVRKCGGAACRVYLTYKDIESGKEYGIKGYGYCSDRNDCANRQKIAYRKGFGPKVFGTFSLKNPNKQIDMNDDVPYATIYFYITEHAIVPAMRAPKTLVATKQKHIDFANLCHIMDAHDWGTDDIDLSYNTGYIGARLVCIDFDDATLSC